MTTETRRRRRLPAIPCTVSEEEQDALEHATSPVRSHSRSVKKKPINTRVSRSISSTNTRSPQAITVCRDRPSSPDDSDDDKKKKKKSRRQPDEDRKQHKRKRSDDSESSDDDDDPSSPSDSSSDGDDTDGDKGEADRSHVKKKKPKPKPDASANETKSKESKQKIKPNKFNGKGSVETFLAQFEVCAEVNNWSVTEKAAQLKCCLIDEAGTLIWDSGNPAAVTYTDLVDRLQRRYGYSEQQEKFEVELRARRQGEQETLAELYQDIKCKMIKAYPGESTSALYDRTAREFFLAAMKDRKMASKIREKEPRDLEMAFKQALRFEAFKKADDSKTEPAKPQPAPPPPAEQPVVPRARGRRDEGRRDDGLNRRIAQLEQMVVATALPSPTIQSPPQPSSEVQELKRQLNDMSRELGRLQALQPNKTEVPNVHNNWPRPNNNGPIQNPGVQQSVLHPMTSSGPRDWSRFTCYSCGAIGYTAKFCKQSKRQDTKPTQVTNNDTLPVKNQPPVVGTNRGTKETRDAKPKRKVYLQLTINKAKRLVLLDTGSDVTLLPSFVVKGQPIESCDSRILAANGTAIRIKGRATVDISADGHNFLLTGLVTDHVAEPMIGFDFLDEHDANWKFKDGEVTLDGHVHKLYSKGRSTWCRRVALQEDCVIPARAEADVPTRVLYNDLTHVYPKDDICWTTEAGTMKNGLRVSRIVLPDRDEDVPIRVLNVKEHPISMSAGTVVSSLEPVELCGGQTQPVETNVGPEDDEMFKEMVSRCDPSVTDDERQQLLLLLKEFSTVFSKDENDLGRTDLVTHVIDTGDNRPVRQPLRRQPPAYQQLIKQHVTSMLAQGVIEPARSPWASNIVLVKKKDGGTRCCIDYRRVNALTHKDAYPLPRTDACLDAMAGSVWFVTLDLRNSYHQIPMDPQSADATAFICSEGMYRFRTMPFGLACAGATFQRLMDLVMSGLTYEICLTYLDDVICFGPTVPILLERLRLVLDRLRQAGLKLKPSKCCFLVKSVAFLGHTVCDGTIGVDYEKIRHVVEWPVPRNLKEVRGFIGLASYYRRFVKDFGKIAAPLNAMSEKNRRFEWTPECQTAFDTLKQLLTSPPVLAMPNQQDPFVLDCDASMCAIGAVLSQIQDGVERPVAYASKKLSKAEMNYCVTRKELLAVVFFLKYFRHYLLGQKFSIRTDHAALQWLHKIKDPVGQLARWVGYLQEYDFQISYRPGNRHMNADQMSRKPCRVKDCPCGSMRNAPEVDNNRVETEVNVGDEGGGRGTQRLQEEVEVDVDTTDGEITQCRRLDASKRQSPKVKMKQKVNDDMMQRSASKHLSPVQLTDVDISGVSKRVGVGGETPRVNKTKNGSTQTPLQLSERERISVSSEVVCDEDCGQMPGEPPRHAVSGGMEGQEKGLKEKLYGAPVQGLHKVTCNPNTANLYDGMGLDEIRLDDRVVSGLLGQVVVSSFDECCRANLHPEWTESSQSDGVLLSDMVGSSLPANVVVSPPGDCCIANKNLEGTESHGSVGSDKPVGSTRLAAAIPVVSQGVNVEDSVRKISDVSENVVGGNSDVNNQWVYTWVLAPREGDVLIEILEDPEVMLVKRKCPETELSTADESDSKLLWTLIELKKNGENSEGKSQYQWKFAPINGNFQTAIPENDAIPVVHNFQSRAEQSTRVENDNAVFPLKNNAASPDDATFSFTCNTETNFNVGNTGEVDSHNAYVNTSDVSERNGVVEENVVDERGVTIGTNSITGNGENPVTVGSVVMNGEVENVLRSCAVDEEVKGKSSEVGGEGLIDFSLSAIASEQKLDRDIGIILQLKQQGGPRPDWDSIASESMVTKALWQQWNRLEVRSDVLFRRFEMLDGRPPILQIVMPYKLKRDFFVHVHGGIGGHLGRKRTERQIQLRAYWPGWTVDVRRYMKMCELCAQYHRGPPPKLSSLKPFPAGEVWETVSIDITGPHPKSRQGHVYLLTIMDHFSKWADAIPIRNHTAVTVARVLFERIFVYMGMPRFLLSDCGAEFESSLFLELCKYMGIQKLRTTPYRASTNGMCERFHRCLNTMLAKLISDNQRDWCDQAPIAAAAYRASLHESTGYSPNFLVFGRENRMPIDIVLNCPAAEEKFYTSTDEYVEEYQRKMRKAYEHVRQNLGQAAMHRKDYYDRKVKETEFTPGSWVWYLYPRRRVGKSPKWSKYYTGPYLLIRLIPPNDVVLQKSKKSKSFVVHRDKIKLCHGPTPESWLKNVTPEVHVTAQPESAILVPDVLHVDTNVTIERPVIRPEPTIVVMKEPYVGACPIMINAQPVTIGTQSVPIDANTEHENEENCASKQAITIGTDTTGACEESYEREQPVITGTDGTEQCVSTDRTGSRTVVGADASPARSGDGVQEIDPTEYLTPSRMRGSRPKRIRRKPAYLLNFV